MSQRLRAKRCAGKRWVTAALPLIMLLAACGGDSGETAAVDTPAPTAPDAGAEQGTATEEDTATEQETSAEETATDAEATASPSPLAGETIEFAVPYGAGGGYDQYARLIAPFLGDCLDADVIVLNEPGAGGLLATNQTAIAPPDGTRIQIMNTPGAATAQIAGAEGANFDLTEMSWVGRVTSGPEVVAVAPDSEFETFQDLIDAERPVRFAASGPGGGSYTLPSVLAPVYGFEADIITGFSGSGEIQAAVARGDADARVTVLDAAAGQIESGELRPLLLVGAEDGQSEFDDIPTTDDIPPAGEAEQQVIDSYAALAKTGRSVVAPPEVPDNVLASLRDGLRCALEDEEMRAQAEKAGRPLDPLSGEETAELVESVLDSPAEFRELVRQSFG